MNEPVKFRHLNEIAAHLHERLNDMQSGNLEKDQLEELTELSRELYERLVVLRFKVYDNEAKADHPSLVFDEPLAEIPPQMPISFRLSETKPEALVNQVSLIDAIEEATKSQPVSEPVKTEEPVNKPTEQKPFNHFNSSSESVAEKFAKTLPHQGSLAQKHESTPISDLKKAITLNQRFQFSKELFKGNNQDYEVTIERINSTSREEAMKTLETLRSKYSWNNESPAAIDFVELIERRFPQ